MIGCLLRARGDCLVARMFGDCYGKESVAIGDRESKQLARKRTVKVRAYRERDIE